jgi:hypothetical protein
MTRQVVVVVLSVLIAAAVLVAASALAARRLYSSGSNAVLRPASPQNRAPVADASARPASDKFRNVLGGLLGYVSHSGSAQGLTKDNSRLNQWLAATGQGPANFQATQTELPADLALPPGATVLLTAPAQTPGSQDLLIMVRAPLSRDAALEFFRQNAAANQWTVIGSSANMATGGAALTIDRGHGERVIAVHQTADRQESMIAIFDAR